VHALRFFGMVPLLSVLLAAEGFSPSHEKAPQSSEAPCAAYFGVLQDDPGAPGRYVARMTNSQAGWYAKNGRKLYPGLCLSLEKARFLIVWTVSTETRTFHTTETRTASETTSTTGNERGTFQVYGTLSAWGSYSGTSKSFSTTTTAYQESVPVTIAADHCRAYVLKSFGPTVWDDIRTRAQQPPAIFSTEQRGANKVKETGSSLAANTGLILGTALSHAVRREPTSHALDAALRYISVQPAGEIAAPQGPSTQTMRNADVLQLKHSDIGDELIIEAITRASSVEFEVDTSHLVELHKAGLSDAVLQAMLHRSKP
jgi:hypothetical protein